MTWSIRRGVPSFTLFVSIRRRSRLHFSHGRAVHHDLQISYLCGFKMHEAHCLFVINGNAAIASWKCISRSTKLVSATRKCRMLETCPAQTALLSECSTVRLFLQEPQVSRKSFTSTLLLCVLRICVNWTHSLSPYIHSLSLDTEHYKGHAVTQLVLYSNFILSILATWRSARTCFFFPLRRL